MNNKNVDRLFREKFKDFEAAPSQKSWNNISKSINQKPSNLLSHSKFYIASYTLTIVAVLGMHFYNAANEDIVFESFISNDITKQQSKTTAEVTNHSDQNKKFTEFDNLNSIVIPSFKNDFKAKSEKHVIEELPHTNVIVENNTDLSTVGITQVNIFKSGQNNQILKTKTVELSEMEIQMYINSISDSTNTIIQTSKSISN